ncbi:MAG: choice-of-anchor B family protein, partial [Bacteroidota bacterium]
SDPDRPRRLNVGLIEDVQGALGDGRWGPDGSSTGGFEWLVVFASDYDPAGDAYAGETAFSLDAYVGLAARVRDGFSLYQAPAEMTLTPAALRGVRAAAVANGTAELVWTAATFAGGTELRVEDEQTGAVLLATDPASGQTSISGLDPSRRYSLAVRLLDDAGSEIASRTVSVRPAVSQGVAGAVALDPSRAGTSTYGDIWGYVDPGGSEYALLTGRGTGLSVIDLRRAPAGAPVEVGFVASPAGARDAKDVKVFGTHAYVVHEVGPVQIVDLSDPASPREVGLLDVQPGTPNGGSHNLLVAEGHLWVVGGRTVGNAGLRVYSLADPAQPAFVGAFRPEHRPVPYYHDVEVRGGLAYGSAIYQGGGVDVLDVSDPSDIRLVSTFTYPGAGAHNTCSTDDGATVYVGDEIGASGNWMRIFDVSDVENAELVGEIIVDPLATVHNCYVAGDRLFVAHYTEGLRVFDVSDPHEPVEVAFYDTFLEPTYGFSGAWTAYPYLPSGRILVSDMQAGLWVIQLDGLFVSAEETARPAGDLTLQVFPNPSASRVVVSASLGTPVAAEITVTDLLGRVVARPLAQRQATGALEAQIDVSSLAPGTYVVRIRAGDRIGAAPMTVVR